jgi:hypothetical protein
MIKSSCGIFYKGVHYTRFFVYNQLCYDIECIDNTIKLFQTEHNHVYGAWNTNERKEWLGGFKIIRMEP